MKSFQGSPVNIDRPILGRITKNSHHRWFNRKKTPQVLAVLETKTSLPKSDAYIISGFLPKTVNLKIPYIEGLSHEVINDLKEGDVVLLSNDGKINVLYEINSCHSVILTTNRCNLKCIMCPQPPSADKESLLSYNLSLIQMMNPEKTKTLAITGGEPTLLGDDLFKLVQACKEYLPKTSLIILSNGKKFSDLGFTRELAITKHPNLVIAIPLYSDIDTIHDFIVGSPRSFYETIKGIHNLALFRQKVEIRTVIHAFNYKRLLRFAEFVYHNLPFTIHIAFMGMEIVGLARENINQLWIDPYDYSYYLEKAVQYLHRANMHFSIYNHQLCILPKKLRHYCRKSISEWKNIYLDECLSCAEKDNCGGFFKTSGNYFSKHIHCISY